MLLLVHVVLLRITLPNLAVGDDLVPVLEAADGGVAVGSHDVVAVVVATVGEVTAHVEATAAVGVFKGSAEVVVDVVAERHVGANLAATGADDAHRRNILHRPGDLVEGMDRLFSDVIAREPRVVLPIADVVLEVAPPRLPRHLAPETGGVIGGVDGPNRADRTVVNAVVDVAFAGRIAPAESGDEVDGLLGGELHRLANAPQPRRIDRHRLLAKNLLSSLDGSLEVEGPEGRRRGEEDNIAGFDELLVAVEAGEATVGGDIKPLRPGRIGSRLLFDHALEDAGTTLGPVGKGIGNRPEDDPWISRHRLRRSARPTAAAADKPDFKAVAAASVGPTGHRHRQSRRGSRPGGNEAAARHARGVSLSRRRRGIGGCGAVGTRSHETLPLIRSLPRLLCQGSRRQPPWGGWPRPIREP